MDKLFFFSIIFHAKSWADLSIPKLQNKYFENKILKLRGGEICSSFGMENYSKKLF